MNDFDLLCAIGSGTCGEVSKMKHKPTGRVLAVKVSKNKIFYSMVIMSALLQVFLHYMLPTISLINFKKINIFS